MNEISNAHEFHNETPSTAESSTLPAQLDAARTREILDRRRFYEVRERVARELKLDETALAELAARRDQDLAGIERAYEAAVRAADSLLVAALLTPGGVTRRFPDSERQLVWQVLLARTRSEVPPSAPRVEGVTVTSDPDTGTLTAEYATIGPQADGAD